MIFSNPESILLGQIFLAINEISPNFTVNLKLEGLSITGSIKVKSALHMLNEMERSGRLRPGMSVIESSSGNLGLALSMICASKGYKFVCITDPNISSQTANMIRAYGSELIIVKDRDANGGYLGTRIGLIKSMLKKDANLVWINQYENETNIDAHYKMTGAEILKQFPKPDYVFIGAGTTGTLGGVSKYLREHSPNTIIIAVDSVGSVTFDNPPGRRHIPGLGTSAPPYIRKFSSFDNLLMIKEIDAIRMCHGLARKGLLLGGSSGTVLCGVKQYANLIPEQSCVVAISPDMGDRYIDTIYSTNWVKERFNMNYSTDKKELASFKVIGNKHIEMWVENNQQKLFDLVCDTYVSHASGKTVNPNSYFLRYPNSDHNRIIALPASLEDDRPISGMKWIASFPDNIQYGLNRASAVLILNDRNTGYPLACLEGSTISAARTAASAAVGASYLHPTPKYAKRLGVIGCGPISFGTIKLLFNLGWDIPEIALYDISTHRANFFKNKCQQMYSNVTVSGMESTIKNSDMILFATSAVKPFIADQKLFSHNPTILHMSLRDLSVDIVLNSQNFVDDIDHCLREKTSLHLAEMEVSNRDFVAGSISDLINKSLAIDKTKPRVFSPFGMGILDIAVARDILNDSGQTNYKEYPDFFPTPYVQHF